MPDGAFRGRGVLITEASSGIGRAAARAYGAQGAHLVLAARREELLRELARELEGLGSRAVAVRCDITQPAEVARLMREAEEHFGGVDILVNNAGIGLFGPVEALAEEQLRQVFELKVAAAMVKASRRRRRDTILTLPGRMMVLANRFVPGLFDRVARRMIARMVTRPQP